MTAMREPSLERMAHLTVAAWELALRSQSANGHRVPEDVAWCVNRLALSAPATAARCRYVMRALDPEVAQAVRRLAGEVSPVNGEGSGGATDLAPATQQPSGSEQGRDWLTTRQAAAALRIGLPGVRAAIARGRLAATRTTDGWHISPADLEQYQHRR